MCKRVAIVTGGERGIGAAIVDALQLDGFEVVSASRKCLGSNCHRTCDVRSEESIAELVSSVVNDFGRIDVLVNNAAVVSTTDLLSTSASEWNDVISTNLTGAFLMCKHVIPHMITGKYGRVISIGSIAGVKRSITASAAYTCSKYGVTGLTKQIAPIYAADGITLNCVCPSQTMTDMLKENVGSVRICELMEKNPSKRLAMPNDVSGAVRFLASEHASYINGVTLEVTGGII